MSIAREEVFGPVLSVLTFESIEKALRIANNTPYGLSGWSANIDTCMGIARGVRSGTVWVNTFMEGIPEATSSPAWAANWETAPSRTIPRKRIQFIAAPAPAGGAG